MYNLCLNITDDMRKIFTGYDTKYIITIPALVPKVLAAKADLENVQVLIKLFLELFTLYLPYSCLIFRFFPLSFLFCLIVAICDKFYCKQPLEIFSGMHGIVW